MKIHAFFLSGLSALHRFHFHHCAKSKVQVCVDVHSILYSETECVNLYKIKNRKQMDDVKNRKKHNA